MILDEPQATQDIVQRLRETEDRFKVMADSSPVMLWMSAVDSNCYFFNKPWLDFTGRTLDQEVGSGWCEGVYFEDFQHCLDTYLDHFNARKPFRMRYRLRRHDGHYRWLLDTGVPRYSPDGTFMGFVGSCIDIQEMVEASEALANLNATLERRVQERTAQLADANRELESFAYSVSHDLRAPLRQIGSYTELIRNELPPELVQGTLERYLGFLQEGADRAQELVRDMLEFSRVSGVGLHPQRVALAPIVAELQRMLPAADRASRVHWGVDALPEVTGDATLLRLVFQNLIENALNFTEKRSDAAIRITHRERGGEHVFAIEDNGIGFDPSQSHRLFKLFQRLHGEEECSGSGIGLANVARIVKRHGGRVWAEGKAGEGAAFYFTLPLVSAGEPGSAA
ncbi:MAG TPA: ATP-binding protein [Myxococcota bacterium]|nr:ATP-binding protein [Myxococcota bacterium]